MKEKIVYIAHPIGGDVQANLADLRRILRKLNLAHDNIVPFCPYYADVVSLDDSVPEERARGLLNDHALFAAGFIDEVWLTGDRISEGMQKEKELAILRGIPVYNYIGLI